ncbi:CBS domain-containing protein [Botrimarina hoheduenensis]|uniref:CBS domain protein n=1 Tax=Botrimarina hoheduenensis TaxID=2528000 RepID=A0A5C5WCD5_9BACT|nr:CBS domain-containing protein [Botrimarina hoheduenensis]TWT47701.1 CBS domain protein [Botrimarina hoheduenensis]
MILCPFCGFDELIEGADTCEQCEQALTDVFIRAPAKGIEASLLHDTVGALPAHPPVEVGGEVSLSMALKTMVERRIGCLLVVNEDRLVGIFSERDALIRLGVNAKDLHDQPLVKFMTPNPMVVSTHDKVAVAIHRMAVGGYRHLPVMDGERPVSLISIRDILRYLTEHSGTSAA